jgi:hypothetical protein
MTLPGLALSSTAAYLQRLGIDDKHAVSCGLVMATQEERGPEGG